MGISCGYHVDIKVFLISSLFDRICTHQSFFRTKKNHPFEAHHPIFPILNYDDQIIWEKLQKVGHLKMSILNYQQNPGKRQRRVAAKMPRPAAPASRTSKNAGRVMPWRQRWLGLAKIYCGFHGD